MTDMKYTHRFYYPDSNVVQDKVLVSHQQWLLVKAIAGEDEYKKALRELTGGKEWFTEQSPLYDAISTGKLLLYNGQYANCRVEDASLYTTTELYDMYQLWLQNRKKE